MKRLTQRIQSVESEISKKKEQLEAYKKYREVGARRVVMHAHTHPRTHAHLARALA